MEKTACLECGAPVPPDVSYCPNCGAAQSPSDEPVRDAETITPTKYYGSKGALVTSERVLLSGKPYPLTGIRSATMSTAPANRIPGMVIATIFGLILVVAMAGLTFIESQVFGAMLILGSLGLGFGAYRIIRARAAYTVQIDAGQGPVDAMRSTDRAHVEAIVQAINQAARERE